MYAEDDDHYKMLSVFIITTSRSIIWNICKMNEWMNEWVSEWIEWMNEWMNEQMNEWMNDAKNW